MIDHFFAFIGIAVLVIVTPGSDTALVIRNALVGGHRAGVVTSVGVVTGQAIWTLLTSTGGVALLRTSALVLTVIKFAGAAYLVSLGIQALGSALRLKVKAGPPDDGSPGSMFYSVAFRQGVINNLANPKSLLFFASLMPQFILPGRHAVIAFLVLGLIFCLLTLTWLAFYSFVVAKVGDILRQGTLRRILGALTGVSLVAFGVLMAVEHGGSR